MNMALLKSKKEEIVKDLKKAVDDSSSVVFINFHGIKVADETVLRKNLRDQGVGYKVARKTLLKRAVEKSAEGTLPELGGEVAVAYSKDSTAPAREVYNFEKSHKGVLSILGGIFEGKFVDGVYMTEIAIIPSREVLLSKIAFLLKSPMQKLVIAISEVANKK
jgi:large subunit ribosomal protein L10